MIKNILKLSPSYSREINEIADKAGALPLDILLFCKMLYNSQCFVLKNNKYEIAKPEDFSRQLKEFPESFVSIVEIRLSTIKKKYSSLNSITKLFQLILFFDNRLPSDIARAFNIQPQMISNLKRDLLISETVDTDITFFMIIIIDILVKRELSTNLMKEIWKSFLNIQFHTKLPLELR